MELKKTFIAGKMNKDLDERLVPDGEFIDALNVTIDTASGSNIGAVSNSLGNIIVTNIQQLVEDQGVVYVGSNAKTIGAVTYEADNLIYWLVTSDNFDAIFEYSEIFQITSIVLLCTNGQLNLSKNFPVTGINFIPASKDEGPFLYWTDGLNPPRRINIARCKSYSTDDPRIDEDINVILRPPLYSPKIDLYLVPSLDISNNIQEKFIYFSYRFKYKDSQYSSLAPFSAVAFHANSFTYDYNTGDNKGMLNEYNKVDVTVDTGNEFVEEIQVLYFDTYKLNVYIVDNYNKSDIQIPDDFKYKITFSANKIYTPLESSEVTRLFDNVPLTAKAQEIIGNRLVYGNYVQFRDIINSNGIKIIPNYTLSIEPETITTKPKKTFRSDRDYEIGVVYLDEYGRMTTALTSKTNTLYIPSLNSDTANSIKVTLNNEPPFWATNYRFVIKQPQGDYYNIFPILFIADDVFRYFLINESDRDKITVGGYIIFKTSNGDATYSIKQFKVLELEYKQATSPFTTEGLYFKIKADPGDSFIGVAPQINYSNTGSGRGPKTFLGSGSDTTNAVTDRIFQVDGPFYYSVSGDNTIQNQGPGILFLSGSSVDDVRITIEIVSTTEFKWTTVVDASAGFNTDYISSNYTITTGSTSIDLFFESDGSNPFFLYTIGDQFVFNVRGTGDREGTPTFISGNYGLATGNLITMDPDDYGGHSILNYNGPIYPGALIDVNINNDGSPSDPSYPRRVSNNSFPASVKYYQNIEEWFYRSGAYSTFVQYNQSNASITNSAAVTFRNGWNLGGSGLSPATNTMQQNPGGGINFFNGMCMLIRGFGQPDGTSRNEINATLTIQQDPTSPLLAAETVPLVSDIDVFYEMRKTYRIEGGNHMVSWPYADYTDANIVFPSVPQAANGTVLGPINPNSPASNDLMHWFNVGERIYVRNSDTTPPIDGPPTGDYDIIYVTEYAIVIDLAFPGVGFAPGNVFYKSWESDQNFNTTPLVVELNNVTSDNSDFNAFAFGNGVESYRIYDNFLRPTMKYSPRATSVIEDYKQEEKFSSLCYSGIFKGDTSTNRLNSFNLSQANFKNLDKQYGPIQKLYALDTNLIALQQDKITSVLYGKNLLVDAVGGGQVASVPEVLGNQIVHPSEYGISNNPESFAKFSNMLFFSDSRRGAVLQMIGDQVIEISANGMRNYFRDELKDNPNTQKLGAYDPYNDTYVLSFTDVSQNVCDLSISRNVYEITGDTSGLSYYMFSIMSSSAWSITLVDIGYGTDWLSLMMYSGYGNQDITANIDTNNTESERSVSFVIEYCDNQTKTFTLTQYSNG
jgi:hypothetical protein